LTLPASLTNENPTEKKRCDVRLASKGGENIIT